MVFLCDTLALLIFLTYIQLCCNRVIQQVFTSRASKVHFDRPSIAIGAKNAFSQQNVCWIKHCYSLSLSIYEGKNTIMTSHKIMAITLTSHSSKNAKQAITPMMINGPYNNSNTPPSRQMSVFKNLFNNNVIK